MSCKKENRIAAETAIQELIVVVKLIKGMSGIDEFERIKILSLAHYVTKEAEKVPFELP